MTWRRVVVYWVLALAVAAQLGWTLRSRVRPAEAEATAVAPIVDAPTSTIDDMLAQRGEQALEFRKEDDRWRVEETGSVVSSDLVAAFIDTLATIPPVEVVSEGSAALATYGLEPPESVDR